MQEVATWFRVTLWRQQAENAAKYLTKGSPVYVEGRLGVEEWTDRDGNKRFTFEVNGTDMHFISGGGRSDEFSAAGSLRKQIAGPADPPASEFSRPAKLMRSSVLVQDHFKSTIPYSKFLKSIEKPYEDQCDSSDRYH